MTRTSGRRHKSGGGINIDLLEIKYDSTCISLSLPLDMSCNVCRPKMEATIGLTKKVDANKNEVAISKVIVGNAINYGKAISEM